MSGPDQYTCDCPTCEDGIVTWFEGYIPKDQCDECMDKGVPMPEAPTIKPPMALANSGAIERCDVCGTFPDHGSCLCDEPYVQGLLKYAKYLIDERLACAANICRTLGNPFTEDDRKNLRRNLIEACKTLDLAKALENLP